MAEYVLDPGKIHFRWNNMLDPALHIRPGDTVSCWAQEVSNAKITPYSVAEDLAKDSFDFSILWKGQFTLKAQNLVTHWTLRC